MDLRGRNFRRSRDFRTLFASSLRDYLQAHGNGWRDSLRLYAGYGISLGAKVVRPRSFHCVGAHIPGQSGLVVSVGGWRFQVRPTTNDLDLLLHHERRVEDWFRVKPGDVVVDVGAHIGKYSIPKASEARIVVALEPEPSNFALLERNIRLNALGNVRAIRVAASDRPHSKELWVPLGPNRGMSTLEGSSALPADVRGGEVVEVPCETLDRLVADLGLEHIDWLKVDVEGHEVPALQGATRALAVTDHLILEVSDGHESACRRILDEIGFGLLDVDEGYPASNWLLGRERRR